MNGSELYATIVNRGEWLKQSCQDLCWMVYVRAQSVLFFVHTVCTSYVIKTFLFVNSSVSGEQLLCFVHGKGRKGEQKT